jgi:hypothetical protein
MRTGRLAAAGLALVTVAAASLFGLAGAAGASVTATNAKSLAVEVCEDMVRDAVISASGGPLASPQVGAWNAKGNRYTCTYPLTGGQLTLQVDSYPSKKKAQSAYAKAAKKVKVDQNLLGIGERALLAKSGKVLAEKDVFVLTADPAKVPPKLSKPNISLAAVEAVLSCWVGTGASS